MCFQTPVVLGETDVCKRRIGNAEPLIGTPKSADPWARRQGAGERDQGGGGMHTGVRFLFKPGGSG